MLFLKQLHHHGIIMKQYEHSRTNYYTREHAKATKEDTVMPFDLCNCYNLQLCSAYGLLKGLKNLSTTSSFHSLKVVFMQHQKKRARLPYSSLSL